MSLQDHLDRIQRDIAEATRIAHPPEHSLTGILRYIARWRSTVIAEEIVRRNGPVIQAGPFAGMEYLDRVAEGALAPRLLGTYEAELHPHFAAFAAEGVRTIVDIGCAEGYYAVGLARALPAAQVHAFDIDPKARRLCAELAARNGVADRVVVGERFDGERFADYGREALVIVDIEGGEGELLDPERFAGLRGLNLIVETHPAIRPGVVKLLIDRFEASHAVIRVDQGLNPGTVPDWLARNGSHLDVLLAAWEWRANPTPWLVMRPRRA